MQATITLYGYDENITQDVRVEYDIEVRDGLWEPMWYAITRCKILDEITIDTSDIVTDVQEQLRFQHGYKKTPFKLECEIETVKEKTLCNA